MKEADRLSNILSQQKTKMADTPKKMTLGDLLQQKQDYDLHTFGKWNGELQKLIALTESGDASAIHVLLKIALTATQAIEHLVVDGEAPIRFFSAIAPVWPIIHNATPHVPPVVPDNLGERSEGPLDLSRVYKLRTDSRDIMIHVLSIIYYLREYDTTIRIQNRNIAAGRGWLGKTSTEIRVPGTDETDTFEATSYNEQIEHLKYEFHLHALITSRFTALLECLQLPARDATSIFSIQEECVKLPDEVDLSWQNLCQKMLKDLAGGTLSKAPALYELGKKNEEKSINRAGEISDNTGNVDELIRRRLNEAFKKICKNFS